MALKQVSGILPEAIRNELDPLVSELETRVFGDNGMIAIRLLDRIHHIRMNAGIIIAGKTFLHFIFFCSSLSS